MIRLVIVAAAILVLFSAWFVPKYNAAQKLETPCVKLIGSFYYCEKPEVIQKYLDRIKINPSFTF